MCIYIGTFQYPCTYTPKEKVADLRGQIRNNRKSIRRNKFFNYKLKSQCYKCSILLFAKRLISSVWLSEENKSCWRKWLWFSVSSVQSSLLLISLLISLLIDLVLLISLNFNRLLCKVKVKAIFAKRLSRASMEIRRLTVMKVMICNGIQCFTLLIINWNDIKSITLKLISVKSTYTQCKTKVA